MKLNGWNDGGKKPSTDGVYQRNYATKDYYFPGTKDYCRYEDGIWYAPCRSEKLASIETTKSHCPKVPWRGISKKKRGKEIIK